MGAKGSTQKTGLFSKDIDFNEELDDIEIKKHFSVSADNTIKFEFKYNKENYIELTNSIEKTKNLLRLENPDEIQALIFKIRKSSSLIKKEDELKRFEDFVNTIERNYRQYIQKFKELFSMLKVNFIDNQDFILRFLRGEKNSVADKMDARKREEKAKLDFNESYTKYHKFADEINFMESFLNNLSSNLKDKIYNREELKQFYEENEKNICLILDETKKEQNISFILFIGEFLNFFKSRNELVEKFVEVYSKKTTLYILSIKSINSANFDSYDLIAELNDYIQVMYKHRFIRHIMANYKFFCQEQ